MNHGVAIICDHMQRNTNFWMTKLAYVLRLCVSVKYVIITAMYLYVRSTKSQISLNCIIYRIRQNIRGGKLSRFINNVHYVGKTFAVCSLKAHARLCNTDFRVCAN